MRKQTHYVPLANLVEINPKDYPNSEVVHYIAMEDVSDNAELLRIGERPRSELSPGQPTFRDGDVLFAKITPCMENGKGAFVSGLDGKIGQGSTEFHVLRARNGTNSRFIYHWTRSKYLRRSAAAMMTGSAGQRRVPRQFFERFLVPAFNELEQQRIAETLDTLDGLISNFHAYATKLKLVQAGTVSRLMTHGLSGNASSWPQFACKDAFSLSSGLPYPAPQPIEGKTPIYGASGISGYGDRQLTPGPTFTIGRVGEGGVGIVHHVPGAAWITDNALWATSINPGWHAEFIARYLSWFNLRRVRSQTGQPLVTQGVISPLPIPKPPKAEQLQIVSILQSLDEAAEKNNAELEKLRILKYGLMDDLLTGRVRVSEAEAVLEDL
ncbi:restriction endonuclease subunit S [Thermoactinospora rubra]|uniref:restriction endonuclease subunit S n=1 Tax=Thermoactinospora rubra TaxID=1088767 RepID=UPI000A1229D7|nr:restriction endonuclease subunit S [Thermoactinospora rubra]